MGQPAPANDLDVLVAFDEIPVELIRELYAAWTPPPDLTVSEWADEERRLSPESSAEPGKWRTGRAEYARGIMDAASDPRVRIIAWMSSAQVGKTEVINNICGYHVDVDPCPMLVVQPTVDMGKAWSKDRLAPMIRDTPNLKGKVADVKSRDESNTILHKMFPGGHLTVAGANSPASLASRPVRLVLPDEVDRYPPSAGAEGDPVKLAQKRNTTFWNRLTVMTSTPTIKGASRIEREYELSDKRRFFVPCPHCDHRQHLKWANVSWPKGQPELAQYGCEGCGVLWTESERRRAVSRGEWIATVQFECLECGERYELDQEPPEGPCRECEADEEFVVEYEFDGRAGFHLNEIYSPWVELGEMAIAFVEARGDIEALKAWINTSLGETFEERGASLKEAELGRLIENYDETSLPDDILLVTAAVDVQGDRLEARSQGWGEGLERWNIEKRIFWGDPARLKSRPDEENTCWEDLDEWLKTIYQVGQFSLPIACACIDSGGHHTDEVYRFCKPRQGRKVFAVKGSSEYYAPIAGNPKQHGNHRVMLYSVGTDTAKDQILLHSLLLDEPGPGYIHFPNTTTHEDLDQLKAEERITEFKRGVARRVWKQKKERNEEVDLHVYNRAAYDILDPDIAVIKRKRLPVEPQKPEPAARSTQRRRPARKRKNWATDF